MRTRYRPSPRRRRAQWGGAVALCALATGSTAALLVVANAGVDLVRITPLEPGVAAPERADRVPAGRAGSATPSRESAFGWSEPRRHRPEPGTRRSTEPSPEPSPALEESRPAATGTRPPAAPSIDPTPTGEDTAEADEWENEPEEFWSMDDTTPRPGESGAAMPEAEPASPGEGSVRPTDAAPDSAGTPAVGRVRVRPEPVPVTPSASPTPSPSPSWTESDAPDR